MTLSETLVDVWQQVMVEGKETVALGKKSYRVELSSKKGLRTVDFAYDAHRLTGIEQNPNTQSNWAKIAREGKQVMQFRCEGRYVGVVAEGKLTHYPAWHALDLPE